MRPSSSTGTVEENSAGHGAARTRVLQLIGSLHPGGAEKVVAQLATGLDPAVYEVRVACVRERGRIADEIAAQGIPVTTLSQRGAQSPYLTPWRLRDVIREYRPDVVHSHGIIALTAAGPLAFLESLPRWVHTFHFGNYPYPRRRQMLLESWMCRSASQLVCVAQTQRASLIRLHGLAPERVIIVPNGVGANSHLGDETCRSAKRAEFGFLPTDFVVGTICVLSEQKGITYLLDAARQLTRSHTGIKFLIVGSGPLETELRKQARRDGLEEIVRFAGWRADVEQLHAAIDAFVMPSLWEAMPLALLEAMAARRPIVVTDVGDNSEFVAQGECGIVVKPGDPDALAASIELLLADRGLAMRLASNALRRFETRFGTDRMVESYARLYEPAPGPPGPKTRLRFLARRLANVHSPGSEPDVFLFATPRGGSTWLMEIIASQPGMKYYDEPLNPRRPDVAHGGWIRDFQALMPETADPERIVEFLRGLQQGKHGYMNPTPCRPGHRLLTDRIVFKIHEIEHLMGAVTRECNAVAVCLLRHPISNSLSRHALPRLELFLASPFYSELLGDDSRVNEIRRIAASGNHLQRALVSWCYENFLALKSPPPGLLMVTYEELVLSPESSCDLLIRRLRLPDRRRMLAAFDRPASNIAMSGPGTAAAMGGADPAERRLRLVSRWRDEVGPRDIAQAAEVMLLFGLDAYSPDGLLAKPRYLHFQDTVALAGGATL